MLIARVGTTLVIVPVLLVVLWIGGPILWLVAAAAAFQAAREATALFQLPAATLESTIARIGAPVLVLATALGVNALIAALAILVMCLLSTTLCPPPVATVLSSWERALAAAIYGGLPIALLLILRQNGGPTVIVTLPGAGPLPINRGIAWTLVAFTLTWATDVGAYATGRLLGRHQFAPLISPRKTWEGTIGGILAGTLVFAAWVGPFGWTFGLPVVVGLVGSLAAVVGDLVESSLKRGAGVKDAGALLPGHGGLLDRIDSLAFSTVVVFLWEIVAESSLVLRLGS